MGSLVVILSTLLQICCPGFSGSVLQVTEELEELPPKAMKGFPPPPPPEPAIDDDSEDQEKFRARVLTLCESFEMCSSYADLPNFRSSIGYSC